MSNNFVCEQVGAANFVALWNTSRKTARRSRMLVSCRGCGMGVGQLLLCMAVVWEKALGRELGSSRAAFVGILREGMEEAVSCYAKLR